MRRLLGAAARRLRRAGGRAAEALAIPPAIIALRADSAGVVTPAQALEVAERFRLGPVRIGPWQVREEIAELLRLVDRERPATVLEIGTANGGTLFLFARAAAADALLISVDLPAGRFGGGYPPWRAPLYRSFAGPRQRIELLRADSHRPETLRRVEALLAGRPVDLLFIDGDHGYEGVRSDFETYGALVRPGGLIAFHDIAQGPEELVGGVPRFWAELRDRPGARDIVSDPERPSFGIGLLRTPG